MFLSWLTCHLQPINNRGTKFSNLALKTMRAPSSCALVLSAHYFSFMFYILLQTGEINKRRFIIIHDHYNWQTIMEYYYMYFGRYFNFLSNIDYFLYSRTPYDMFKIIKINLSYVWPQFIKQYHEISTLDVGK